jgi:hypothetical protein
MASEQLAVGNGSFGEFAQSDLAPRHHFASHLQLRLKADLGSAQSATERPFPDLAPSIHTRIMTRMASCAKCSVAAIVRRDLAFPLAGGTWLRDNPPRLGEGDAMPDINWLAAILAGLLGFFPGSVWYSKLMFLDAWIADSGHKGHGGDAGLGMRLPLGTALSIVSAVLFAMVLGPEPPLGPSVIIGAVVGALITMAFGIQYLFEGKTIRLTLINGGFHLVQFTIYGLILGLWH